MKKYVIFVKGFRGYSEECNTLKEAEEFKQYILEGKEKQLEQWLKEVKKLESMNLEHKRILYDAMSNAECIKEEIEGIKNDTHIYQIIK